MNEHTRKILQALLDGETVQVRCSDRWVDELPETALARVSSSRGAWGRVKPKTIALAGIEFPEPMRYEPKAGTKYWHASFDDIEVTPVLWDGMDIQKRWLRYGLLQATREGAELQRKAMILSVGGEP